MGIHYAANPYAFYSFLFPLCLGGSWLDVWMEIIATAVLSGCVNKEDILKETSGPCSEKLKNYCFISTK